MARSNPGAQARRQARAQTLAAQAAAVQAQAAVQAARLRQKAANVVNPGLPAWTPGEVGGAILMGLALVLIVNRQSAALSGPLGSTSPVSGPAAHACRAVHTVVPGDTLSGLAATYDTSVSALVAANQARYPSLATNPNYLEVGWQLCIT